MIREILTVEYLDLAVILTFVAALVTMLVNALTTYWTEKTKRKNHAAKHTMDTYKMNADIVPELRFCIYDLHIKYMELKSCEYLKKIANKCKKECERLWIQKFLCREKRFPNILPLVRLESNGGNMAENISPEVENIYKNHVDDFMRSAKSFVELIKTKGIPLLSKQHTKKVSTLYYDMSLLLQIYNSTQAKNVCVQFRNLESVKKSLFKSFVR